MSSEKDFYGHGMGQRDYNSDNLGEVIKHFV